MVHKMKISLDRAFAERVACMVKKANCSTTFNNLLAQNHEKEISIGKRRNVT